MVCKKIFTRYGIFMPSAAYNTVFVLFLMYKVSFGGKTQKVEDGVFGEEG